MKTRICKVCGESFIPISNNQHYCKQVHKRTCSICGKEFDYRCEADSNPNICYDCRGRKYKKICKVCGKEFISKTPGRQICDGPHYRTCEICGKQFEVPKDRLFDNTLTCCSKECSNVKRSKAIKDAIKMKPRGYNAPKTVHHKICKFCGKPFDTIFIHKEYCDGLHYKTCEVCGKQFEVSLSQIANHTTVCSENCRLLKSRRKLIGNLEIAKTWEVFESDPISYIKSKFNHIPTYYELSNDLHMSPSSIQQMLSKHGCENLVSKYIPTMEQEVSKYILSVDPSVTIVHNTRKVIKPKEIDIYLPDHHIGIECNPTVSHNSSLPLYDSCANVIPNNYHKVKTDLAKQNGIFLLHLFGYEWNHKKDIMKSIIRNLLHKSDRIYARKCEIKDVDSHTAMKFLDENHRQGALGSSTRLGLYYQNELVSLMTFGKSRHTIGKSENYTELLRFCNKLNTTVIGGASKLFKYFIKHYNFNKIISFSDRAHTSGNMYKLLGFELDHISEPGYVWVDEQTDTAYHRINAQKQNIKRFLNDDSIDLSQSETQIMESHGFVKVYDSGTCTWVYESL